MDTDINSHHHHNHHHRIESPSDDGDGEGVWSPDIEECFREALRLFPPCGRRKHVLPPEDGGGASKMYGRNELIARHIKLKTGKVRTRKQVSSHIQVLARRKAKAEAHQAGSSNGVSPSPSSIGSNGNSSAGAQTQSVAGSLNRQQQDEQMQQLHMQLSAAHHHHHQQSHLHQQHLNNANTNNNTNHHHHHQHLHQHNNHQQLPSSAAAAAAAAAALCHPAASAATTTTGADFYADPWSDRPIVTNRIRLVEFSAFIEHRQPNIVKQPTSLLTTSIHPYNHLDSHHHSHPSHHPHHDHLANGSASNPLIAGLLKQSSAVTRHNYVQIDYRQASLFGANRSHAQRQMTRSMLESINIRQIHDKFPGFEGPNSYMQRGDPDAFYLVKFWADLGSDHLDFNIVDDQNSCFGFSSHFETTEPYATLTCSTKACSYGLQVVEKVEQVYGQYNATTGLCSYNFDRLPMCEFMVHFIKKLRQLSMISQMNSVLENFTVLQVIESSDSYREREVLLCLAYVFEVASSEQNIGPSYHVYKLTKD